MSYDTIQYFHSDDDGYGDEDNDLDGDGDEGMSSGRDGVKFNFNFFASTALGATTSICFSWTQWSG